MKKLFKYEINESIAAKAAMNCVHKRLFKELYMGSPTPQEQEENVYSDVLNKIINDGLDYWDVWAMAKQGKATKTELEISSVLLDLFETLMYNGYGEILSKVASGEIDKRELKRIIVDILMEQDVDTFPRGESEYNSWVNEHNSEIVKRLEAKFNEEQEELPSMERHDIILALSEYMAESWISSDDEDGDLDDIYYAVADILDRTGDYPASTSWDDCKPWCQKYYKEVEARIWNEDEESNVTSKVTVRTPMGLKQMSLSTEVIEAFVRQTGSDEFSDRSAVRVISGIVREMMKTGYTPTSDEQEIVDIQNAKIKQTLAKRDEITDRSMNAFTD